MTLAAKTLQKLLFISNVYLTTVKLSEAAPANQVITMNRPLENINPSENGNNDDIRRLKNSSITTSSGSSSNDTKKSKNAKTRNAKLQHQDNDEPDIPSINFTIDGMSANALKKKKPCYLEKSGPKLDLPTRVSKAIDEFDTKDPDACLKACSNNNECNFGRYYDSIERCFLYFAKDANWECKMIHFEFMKNY